MESINLIVAFDANFECKLHFNTTLASIHCNIETNDAYLSVNSQRAWIGLNDLLFENIFTSLV